MAKQHQLELIARDKTERATTKKAAPKVTLKATPKAKPKGSSQAGAKKSPPATPRVVSKPSPKPIVRLTATDMAARQREISVSEFFTKNRHLLGFDSPAKALLTTVKEAVDNSLDACEEAGILPDLTIVISEITETRYRVVVQ